VEVEAEGLLTYKAPGSLS